MRNNLRNILFLIIFITNLYCVSAGAACFTPLSDPKSNIKSDWRILYDHKGDKGTDKDIKFIQELDNADHSNGDKINLDYFSITIDKHPTKSIEEFFLEIRKNFGGIIFKSAEKGQLNGYRYNIAVGKPSFILDNKKTKQNLDKWNSKTPKGALMNFGLKNLALIYDNKGLVLVLEEGDVLVTCSTQRDFIFSTVNTSEHGWHPVSGNRGFGIKGNLDGSWTFYTMAADRLSNHTVSRYFLKEKIFEFGKNVWVDMIDNFSVKYAPLRPRNKIVNSNLYSYPSH